MCFHLALFSQRCTVDLKSCEELKNDADFIKVWVEYVSSMSVVFTFVACGLLGLLMFSLFSYKRDTNHYYYYQQQPYMK